MSDFARKVIETIRKIPRGKVATYGQIARLAGKPHAARGVGWILNSCTESHRLPWQRVLNSQGRISFSPRQPAFAEQRRLLMKEGVKFIDRRSLDLSAYQWKKDVKKRRDKRTPRLFGG